MSQARPAESALLIAVPEAEPRVSSLRSRYDPGATRGIPAHVTVLFPFKAPDQIEPADLEALADTFAAFQAFDFQLTRVTAFPDVWYLAPEPVSLFKALTRAVVARFPECPPYGGAFGDDSIPHLTVAQIADPMEFEAVGAQLRDSVESVLPLQARADDVWLMDNAAGPWSIRRRFRLGAG
jgi:2'-5' RNA ligase